MTIHKGRGVRGKVLRSLSKAPAKQATRVRAPVRGKTSKRLK